MVKTTPKRPPTQREIALHASVSRETVSHILGGTAAHRYNEETRRRVHEAATTLGYHPNRFARAIRRGRSGLIGIIQPSTSLELTRRALHHLAGEIAQHGYNALAASPTLHGPHTVQNLVEMRAEGALLLLPGSGPDNAYAAQLAKAGIPVVGIFGDPDPHYPGIRDGLKQGYTELTRHLLSLGHRRLILPTSLRSATPAGNRQAGFEAALHGIGPVETLEEAAFLEQWPRLARRKGVAGYKVQLASSRFASQTAAVLHDFGTRLLRCGPLPDACLCSNDQGALGLFSAAMESGLTIPKALAVTGADNDSVAALPGFAITTLDLRIEEACTLAMQRLIALIRGEALPAQEGTAPLPARLVLRRSCGQSHLSTIAT